MATGDFDMTAVIEAGRRSRKEWADAISALSAIYAAPVRVIATSPDATEARRAAFEADFNKFLAQQRDLQESAMDRALMGENVYLKIGTEGTLSEIPACEVEMWHQSMAEHFPGCLCERCIGIRADGAYPQAADDPEDRQGCQLDEAIGFVPMSPKPAPEPPSPSPIPARALRYGVAEAPLLEWPE